MKILRTCSAMAAMLVTGLTLISAGCDSGGPSVPSYSDALTAFKAQQARSGPKLSEADMQIMEQAKVDLGRLIPEPGLHIGEQAPDFELPNALGKPVRLSEVLKSGPVVLSFYRGAWCPYCNLQLRGLHESLPHFRRLGAKLVTVTPQKPDKSLAQVKKDGYQFEILSDLDSSVMKAYRLHFVVPPELSELYIRNFRLDLAAFNGPGRYELPVPGTFVIDTSGTVRAAFANVDYTQRMEPQSIIDALAQLQPTGKTP